MCHDDAVTSQLFVDVWSDVVCPFCYLGQRQLRDALERFDARDTVVVRHHAFELDPHATRAYPGSLDEMLAAKYSMPLAQAHALNQRVVDAASHLGMQWNLDIARPTNTFDAHRVIALATAQGRGSAMSERLFRAYFSEGELISDVATLVNMAAQVGVTGADVVLLGDDYTDAVRQDEHLAARIGITGVPALIFDGSLHVSGAQGSDAMLDALRTAWARRVTLGV